MGSTFRVKLAVSVACGMLLFVCALWMTFGATVALIAVIPVALVGWTIAFVGANEITSILRKRSVNEASCTPTIDHDRLVETALRQKKALSAVLFDRHLAKSELSSVLEKLCGLTLTLLPLRRVEITLFDAISQSLYGGVTVGSSRKTSDSGFAELHREEDIRFAGEQIGALSIWGDRQLEQEEEELIHLLTLQVGVAVVNAKYSEALLKMKGESEASVKAKTGFLASLSHELRGPLGIILNATEIVLDGLCGDITADQNETLRMVKLNSSHLLDLINDVLDYAKAEAGKVMPKLESLDVAEILKQTAGMVRAQADQKQHKLEVLTLPEGLYLYSDRRHSRQILINLLTNAVKYTPDGGHIRIGAARAPSGRIQVWVEDSGVGIPEDQRTKVFSAFERIESGYAGRQNGTGLGLSLTKKLVELNGGNIDFRANQSGGTTFEVAFQSGTPPLDDISVQSQSNNADINGAGEKVVLMTRNQDEARLVHRYLQSTGFRVIELKNDDLLDTNTNIDGRILIVGEDGQSSHDALREVVERARGIPTVILTNNAFTADVEDYMRIGFARCVSRPVQLQELARACVDLLRHG